MQGPSYRDNLIVESVCVNLGLVTALGIARAGVTNLSLEMAAGVARARDTDLGLKRDDLTRARSTESLISV